MSTTNTASSSSCQNNVGAFMTVCRPDDRMVDVRTHWLVRIQEDSASTKTWFQDYLEEIGIDHFQQAYQTVAGAVCDPCVRSIRDIQVVMQDVMPGMEYDKNHVILQVQMKQRQDCPVTLSKAFDTNVPLLTSSSSSSNDWLDDFTKYCVECGRILLVRSLLLHLSSGQHWSVGTLDFIDELPQSVANTTKQWFMET